MKTTIAITDDHRLLAQALSDMIQNFEKYEVVYIAGNGKELLNQMQRGPVPDIVLLDISMPEMDGFETALHLKQHYPAVKILALSMTDREEHIVRMIRHGARGYLLKSCRPSELRQALDDIRLRGFHYSEFLTNHLVRSLNPTEMNTTSVNFTFNGREQEFLKMACSDLTYAEIADKMCVSTRTVDGYRESLFQKMNVKSRVGMAITAIRMGLVQV
ncbi:response regulator [Tellurirhabdus rosea]|uniref:response regulator n=1 Tax=Tellurirhabdus rosea TaxID=2674997 RepID=UPI0022515541|nr:response regulator transcription factor [Tellurirhabdus rosea]